LAVFVVLEEDEKIKLEDVPVLVFFGCLVGAFFYISHVFNKYKYKVVLDKNSFKKLKNKLWSTK
jgi:hypothetical protein